MSNNHKHGHSKIGKISKTYRMWLHMIQRCTNPNDQKYYAYGGRGVDICSEWLKFENFLEDMGECPQEYSIDRIDNNNGYWPDNCRWATSKEQARNRRNNRLITFNGQTKCVAAWSEETGIAASLMAWRLNNGWSIERALTYSRPNKK